MKAETENHKSNGKKSSTKLLAGTFPMTDLIGEQLRPSIPAGLVVLPEPGRKQEKKQIKALEKAEKQKAKEKKSAFPMVELIDEQVRTSIPEELVAKVKGAKSKKIIISSNYPYPTSK